MRLHEHVPADDPFFGGVTIRLDHTAGELFVEGDGIPSVVVRRAAGTPLESKVPIGTRDPDRLTMTIGDSAVPLLPAKGFLTRHSYRVDAGSEDARYRLVPVSLGSSRLSLGDTPVGDLTSSGDGKVSADWAEHRPLTPYEAALGYTLAAAFGTGAEPMWQLALDAGLEALN
ncbi:hypothetical protein GCM10010387_06150 [Streptomyces inusitatus]|uniref:Uncharacterized protein n=1 Tax=Streptomyces inusitatus TaxID=68221 RepID=A0A918PP37_9ACTN|nr:hypothetical protein [Streptomyces inusitatus]GGZ16366.1 hypothetical protein GCM10010387_06150 [Streptomyces inusitatus]